MDKLREFETKYWSFLQIMVLLYASAYIESSNISSTTWVKNMTAEKNSDRVLLTNDCFVFAGFTASTVVAK